MKLLAGLFILTWALSPMATATDEDAKEEKPDLPAIKAKSLELLRDVVPGSKPHPKPMTELETAAGIAKWGALFSDKETIALVSLNPGPKKDMWDFLPWHLSFIVWSNGRWEYRQYLGSASQFEIHRRKDLGLQIVQGYCQTERYGGEQSSWQYEPKTRTLLPTGLDKRGPYCIKGDYICYGRGTERRSFGPTTWIYPFAHGKKGELLACMHEEDNGNFLVSFQDRKSKTMKHWAFLSNPEDPTGIKVVEAADNEDPRGAPLAEIRLSKGEELSGTVCFEFLTGLSSELLLGLILDPKGETWTEKVSKSKLSTLPTMEVTGDAEVVQRFQPPNTRSKQ